ncbi:MAG: hypothetical protein AVDCRST_MAG57-1419, partial [uncultured Blastococcus sp.]
ERHGQAEEQGPGAEWPGQGARGPCHRRREHGGRGPQGPGRRQPQAGRREGQGRPQV